MIPAGVEMRLRAHVDAILASAHVPRSDRAELEEELFGHLVERWQGLVAHGADDDAAARQSIRDFGGARHIGGELTSTYRGRFWASTIGVLLPAGALRGSQPRIAWWLGASLRLYGVLYAIAVGLLIIEMSPVRAVVLLAVGLPATALMYLAAVGLGRRQRWALDLAVVVNVIGIIVGAHQMATTTGLLSLNVFGSGVILAIAASERRALLAWVRPSRSVRPRMATLILVVVLGGSVLPAIAWAIPDPTQAGVRDLQISASMDCTQPLPRDGEVAVEFAWAHTSLLPGGIGRMDRFGDALVLEMDPSMAGPLGATLVRAGVPSEVVADGTATPAAAEEVMSLAGPAVIGIDHGLLAAGTAYRALWTFEAWDGIDMRQLQATVAYWHADRFKVEAQLTCGSDATDWHSSGPLPSGE